VTLAPGVGEPMFYFYSDELKFNSKVQSYIYMVGSLADIVGIIVYRQFFKNVSFTGVMVATTVGIALT
jgi:hypothetical protein